MKHYFLTIILLFPILANAQGWLSGTVQDSSGVAVAFATVTIDGSQFGTVANEAGYFRLQLPEGNHLVRVSHLGYQPWSLSIRLEQTLVIQPVLIEAAWSMAEVVITPDGEDPAYAIMREAIRRKDDNRILAEQASWEAYTKTVFKLSDSFSFDSLLRSFVGAESMETPELPDDPVFKTNILYLSETMSTVWTQAPDKIREEIRRSRISGDSKGASMFGNLFNQFSPYDNLFFQGEMAERGIVSPLSDQAMLFYEFRLVGVSQEEGQTVYRIFVLPKRLGDPVVKGFLHIADGSYAVQSLDLWTTKTQAIQVVDSLRMTQTFLPQDGKWLPVTTRMHMAISLKIAVIELPVNGTFTSVLSQYNLEPNLPKGFFSSEVLAVADTATRTDSTWWELNRPIPLVERESVDYRLKDSTERVQNSPEYLDSLTRAQGFPSAMQLSTGYTWQNYRTGHAWVWKGLSNAGFNAIEGWFLQSGLAHRRKLNESTTMEMGSDLRYAYQARRFHYAGYLNWEGKGFHPWTFQIRGGDMPAEFSRFSQIIPFANTYASLIHHRSHVRFYRKKSVQAGGTWEPLPGLELEALAWWEARSPLSNTSEFSWLKRDRLYEPNETFSAHQAMIGEVTVRYQPFQRYVRMPATFLLLDNSWPALSATLTHALPFQPLAPDYTRLTLSIGQEVGLGLAGTLNYRITAGQFLRLNQSYLADAFHFAGGETFFRMRGAFDQFFLMPYYAYSTTSPFLEFHAEQAFGILWVSRVPGLRKLKISEYLGGHALYSQEHQTYAELNYGLEARILKVFKIRFDVHFSLMGSERWLPYAFTYRPQTLLELGL